MMLGWVCPEHKDLCQGEGCCCEDLHVETNISPRFLDREAVVGLVEEMLLVVDDLERLLWELDNGYSGCDKDHWVKFEGEDEQGRM